LPATLGRDFPAERLSLNLKQLGLEAFICYPYQRMVLSITDFMFSNWGKRVIFIYLMLAALIFVLWTGKTRLQVRDNTSSFAADTAAWSPAQIQLQSDTTPVVPPPTISSVKTKTSVPVKTPAISQPKQLKQPQIESGKVFQTTREFQNYTPKYAIALANPSNYGERFAQDANGFPANNEPIIVLHETASTASSAISNFRVPHTEDSKQVSYHALITLDGTIIYLVPPDKRAFGAGNSVFAGAFGSETVKTNSNLPPSVNNFAYHVSLETPRDGIGKNHQPTHSGYQSIQYKSLAWLIAQSQVPDSRITTHRAVDRSGQRIDPRSFNFNQFFALLHSYRQPVLSQQKHNPQSDNIRV
jgi:hypothetical protein